MILIIDINYFEENTIIDTDFDSAKCYNFIVEAHEIQLFELLGEDLFDRVQTALGGVPTPIEQELIDLCKPFLVKATELDFVPFLNSPVTAKGTQERTGNFTTSANDMNKSVIMDKIRARVESYAEKVRKFLDKNSNDFPEWNKCSDDGNFYTTIHLL